MIPQPDWNRALLRLANNAKHEGSGNPATIDPLPSPDLPPTIETVCTWSAIGTSVTLKGDLTYIGNPAADLLGFYIWMCVAGSGDCTDEHYILDPYAPNFVPFTGSIAEGAFEETFRYIVPLSPPLYQVTWYAAAFQGGVIAIGNSCSYLIPAIH